MISYAHRIVVALCFVLAGLSCFAQEVTTKVANIHAPKQAFIEKATRAFGPREELLRVRRAMLKEHHLPIPVRKRVGGARSFRPVMRGAETQVETTSSNALVAIHDVHTFAKVETDGGASTVAEPSIAVRNNDVLITANWFATFSDDGGSSFRLVRPSELFPQTAPIEFCCDQVVLYDPSHDMMVWLLQYEYDDVGNMLRLAVAKGNDISAQHWHYYDLTPAMIGNAANEWFDFPHLVSTTRFLYVSTNAYGTRDQELTDGTVGKPFRRSVMMRLPLDPLSSYQAFALNYYDTPDFAGLRSTQGALDTMYFGSNTDVGQLRVFSWPEQSASLSLKDVKLQDWLTGPAKATCPDTNDWTARVDTRITAAWASGGRIAFAWTAPQDSFFPYPQIRVAVLNATDKSIVAEPIIWNSKFAFALPAAAPADGGDAMLAVHYGGNQLFPSHAAGRIHAGDSSTESWTTALVRTRAGQHAPPDGQWGDYGTVRPEGFAGSWATVGYTLQGQDPNVEVQLDFIRFETIH